ncbi:MAG: hypothetical protein WA160_14775 [Pseudobdellovibrio sp.]
MKSLFAILLMSSLSLTTMAADIEVTVCLKTSKAMQVIIKGESALNIFRALSHRIGLKPAEMINTLSNGMNCKGSEFTSNGDVSVAECSYLMVGQKNIPYPQVDAGFAGEPVIECN